MPRGNRDPVVFVNEDDESTTIALRGINPKNLKLKTRTKPYYILLVEVDVFDPFGGRLFADDFETFTVADLSDHSKTCAWQP